MMSRFGTIILVIGFIVGLAESLESSEPQDCQEGWESIHRGCYKFVEDAKDWESAKEYCSAQRGELTSIQSLNEKESLQSYLLGHEAYKNVKEWWVGFQKVGNNINWLAGVPVDDSVISWKNPRLRKAPRNFCGILQNQGRGLQVHLTPCDKTKPFICEFHAITERPAYQTVITQAPTEPPVATPPSEPSRDPPRTSSIGDDDCPCRDSAVGDAEESPELRLRRRNYALGLSMDEGIYAEYLRSEIDANRARITYYEEVSQLYADALKAQGEFYESYQRKMDLELAQMNQRSQCNDN